jgi:2-haloacid dehalogenase
VAPHGADSPKEKAINRIADPRAAQLVRRQLLKLAAGAAAQSAVSLTGATSACAGTPVRAVAFDAFVIFDPRPIFALAEQLFPGKGAELSALWRIRQFEYTWLRALSGQYANFWRVTEDALVYAAAAARLELTPEKREQLMRTYLAIKAYPDAPAGLQALRRAGIRLGLLSNMTQEMLEAGIRNSGLEGLFAQVLSTDRRRTYKPDPRAYQMAIDAFGLALDEIVFAAFGGWDAAGAKSFGYTTFWANRLGLPVEELDARPDAIGASLTELVKFVERVRSVSR